MFVRKSAVLSALFIFGLSGCGLVNDGVTTIKPTPLSKYSADPSSDLGSRNNPISVGRSVVINDWKVRIQSVNADAQKVILKSDPYASRPAPSERFVLVELKATYVGADSGEPSSDLRFKIVGAGGNTFAKSCGYYSESFDSNGETFSGASVSGNLCFTVDADQIEGATLSVQGDYTSEDRKFIALK